VGRIPSIIVRIYEGEDTENIENDAGVPQLEITFNFDKSRILHVDSRDLKTGSTGKKDVKVK